MRGIVPFYSRWCLLLFVVLGNSLTLAQWSSDPTVNTPVVVVGNNQSSQKMVSDGYGGTIVGWLDYRNNGYETYVQKLNASGVPQWTTNGVQITNSANHDNTTITLASDGHGGVVVTWADTRNASFDIYAQRVDSTGNKVWGASGLNVCNNSNFQTFPAICSTDDGVIISWTDQRNGGANSREMAIFAQKLDINGNAQWTANGVQVIDLPQSQNNTKIVHDGANGALVAMNDESNSYPNRVTIQKLNASGAPQWGTNGIQVTTSTGFTQYLNNVCTDGNGGMIVTWNDQRNSFNPDFYTQRISSAGTKLWGNSGVHISSGTGFTDVCSVTPDGASGAYFAFYKSSPSYTVFAQHVSSAGALSYSGTGATIISTANLLSQVKVTGTTEGNAIISWINNTAKIVYAQKIDSTCATLWTANGIGVATATGEKTSYCEAVTDGGGGAIISFVENRAGNNFDIFAQQINSGGVLGSSPFASTVSVTSPNGTENLFAGETHNITWTSANIANVKIEYTTNNGTNWSTITASIAAATGSYAWAVPANATAQAKVKISDVSNNLINDQSNAAFTITVGTLALTAPNGGEVWVEGRSQNITWTSSNVTNVKLEYSSDNGTNWNVIASSTAAAAGSYSWNIPGVASSQALVKVTDADHASLSDVSNGVFTLRQCNTPDWTFSPVGYQYTMNIVGKLYFEGTPSDHLNDKVAVYVGNQLRGTARVSFLAANTYRVYMTVYSNQASGENLLFQAWDSLNCKIYPRITQEYTFTSNAVIGSLSTPANLSATETLPTLSVTSPNGGEGWIAQTTQNITWASSSVTNIKIEYSTNNGSNWSTISSSTPASTGTYAWSVPTIASTLALVRLTNLFDTSYSDASNAAFSLLIPSVSVTAPNGGETDTATGTRNITWTSSNVENVKIEYSSNNGSSWNTIAASTPANAGTYAWTVPTIATSQVLVKVSDASNANFADTSDAVSAIVIPAISVTSPNGGESYASTFSQNITWTSSNTAIVKIEYSSNNGTDWNTISAGTMASAGTFAWTIPSITSTQVLVRISNANFLSFTDTSDAVFSVFLPAVTLTAPNGGESWNAAASQNITWTSSNVTNVKLEYSTNNGSSWSTISASTAAAAGTYAWTVPSVSTLQALVKISDAAYPSFSDMSNAVFTIQLVDRFYMHSGWTWVSFNKRAANMSVSSVLTGLTPAANDLIKDQTNFAQYVSNDEWFGSLDTIRNTSAYLINMANQDSMDFAGQSILPESTPIAVSAGWNYVAYVPQSALSIGSALASLDVRNEDLVKSQFAFAIYDSLYGWAGDMQQMQPKQGYFLKSTLQNTLTYPAASKSATPAALAQYQMIKTIAGQPEWTLNIGKYPYSMSVIAQLDRTIIDTVSETTVLGVFRNNECRGFAKASYSEITKSYVFYVSVYGEASAHDSLKFRVYNGSTNSVIPVANGIVFEANSVVGKLRSPYGITNSTVAVQKELEIPAEFNLLQNYPNPFNPSTTIGYSLPQESDVHIAVYNVLGQKVKELVNEHKSTGNYSVVWDGTNNYNESVSSGIYIYMIKAGNHQMVKKMTFLK